MKYYEPSENVSAEVLHRPKGDEILFVKQHLCALGAKVLVIDVGVLGAPPFQPDVSREEIAARAGTQLENLVLARDRGKTIAAMERGVAYPPYTPIGPGTARVGDF